MSFPSPFPAAPPLITFSSDIFHPLLTPLTTYTYTTSTSDADTVSATDDERLPPGGFSLRHAFPQWFGRARGQSISSRVPSASTSSVKSGNTAERASPGPPTIYEVLEYIRSAFSEEKVLDSIPLQAAANPGAYHAWQTHRARVGELTQDGSQPASPERRSGSVQGRSSRSSGSNFDTPPGNRARRPGEWNWDGVWEERVRRGIQNSLTEPVLYGAAAGGDDIIRFSDLESEALQRIKEQMARP